MFFLISYCKLLSHIRYHCCLWDLIWCCSPCVGRKGGRILLNDALNTFSLRLYGVRHMVKDHSGSERGKPLSPHGILLPINSRFIYIYAQSQRESVVHTTVLDYTICGVFVATRNSSIGPTGGIYLTTHNTIN